MGRIEKGTTLYVVARYRPHHGHCQYHLDGVLWSEKTVMLGSKKATAMSSPKISVAF